MVSSEDLSMTNNTTSNNTGGPLTQVVDASTQCFSYDIIKSAGCNAFKKAATSDVASDLKSANGQVSDSASSAL